MSRKFAGDRSYYTVLVHGQELKLVSDSGETAKAGDEIRLRIKTDNLLIYDEGGNQC